MIISKTVLKVQEFNYMLGFISDNDLGYDVCRQQIRALWTAYCLHYGYQCDTGTYDEDLLLLWGSVEKKGIFAWIPGKEIGFDSFDLYMGNLLS